MLSARVIDAEGELAPFIESWDALAVAAGRPYASPAWMLAWWRTAAPKGAQLRVAVATDGDGALVGVAPFWCSRRGFGGTWLRLLGAPVCAPTEPLAHPGSEQEAAAALAQALADTRPSPAFLAFDGCPPDSPWPRLLGEQWPGRGQARMHLDQTVAAPSVALAADTFDDWLAGKSSNFRSQVRRMRRKLEADGASFHRIGPDGDLGAALTELARLHHARWDQRGGSAALDADVERMLAAAATELAPAGRLWISTIEIDGRTISAHLFVGAGAEVAYWLGGHDDEFGARKPGLLALVAAVEAGIEGSARLVDLGPGTQEYKLRLADGERRLEFVIVTPPGPARLRRQAALGLHRGRRSLTRRLSDEQRTRLRRLLRRGG